MAKYKIVISDYYYPDLKNEYEVFQRLGDDVEIVDCTKIIPGGALSEEQLIPFVKDSDAVIVQFAKITDKVIDSMKKCKVIARYAIGIDTIDLQAAIRKNIYVANVPNYCENEVADTTLAHILNSMRKISFSRDLLLRGDYTFDKIKPMKRISQSTLCLIGFGKIAQNVAKKAKDIFKEILAVDPYFLNTDQFPYVSFLPLEKALALANVISIHVPLNNTTKNLISKKEFELMRDGVVIVNTSRGGIIDEKAMQESLDTGKISFCSLDVISTEDFMNSPLLKNPRVALTPHIGWYSEESIEELQRTTAENVVEALLNGKPLYFVRQEGI